MFIKPITAPVSPLNQNYFKSIARPRNEPDYSLSSLAVAIIRPRINDYKGVYGYYGAVIPEFAHETVKLCVQENSNEECVKYPNVFYFVLHSRQEEFDEVRKYMSELGCEEIQLIEKYMEQKLQMKYFAVFTHKESNSAFIFAATQDMRVYHLTLGFLPSMLPSIFESAPIIPEELELLKSLSNKTEDKFISLCSKMLMPLKMEMVRTEMAELFRGYRMAKIRNAERDVETYRQEADNALERFRRLNDELNNAIVILEGMKVVNSDENNEQEQEVIDYLSTCPRLHDITYNDGLLSYVVDTYLTNTDVAKFRNVVRTKDIYDGYRIAEDNAFYSKANRKILLDALFNTNEPEISVKVAGKIYLRTTDSWMDVERGDRFQSAYPAIANCLLNPHYKLHGCPGQNRSQIVECLKQVNIVSAIECSIAATGSVNIGETDLTFRPFVQEIFTSEKRIIHRNSDGADLTPAEALLWLVKKQKENVA